MNELNMYAYYYTFHPTGVREIDEILSEVANAGNGFHHTEGWMDKLHDGTTYVERIQAAAIRAAEKMRVGSTSGDSRG